MPNQTRCVVTGLGLICGLGTNVAECWDSAVNGRTGISTVTSVDTTDCYANLGAEVAVASEALSGEAYDRSSLLCIKAAEEAVADAGYTCGSEPMGVILGSCVGGAASIDRYFSDEFHQKTPNTADILKMPASAIANNVATHFNCSGITANIVNACAAGTLSIAYACDQIRSGKGEIFLAGGSDSFSSLAFAGFHALHALDENPCSPFNHSSGITLGEGAGILVVESYEHAVARGAKIYCEILGSGVSSDAHHITAPRPDGEGQMRAIRRATAHSGLQFTDIDYINAHGTGTAKNDEAEFLSLHTLFAENDHLSASSTKSMTGHCLGAAGSIEAVFTVKAMEDGVIPPTIGYSEEDLEHLKEKAGTIDFVPNVKREKDIRFAMSNSFAFGGNNASIIFSKEAHPIADTTKNQPIYITGIGSVCGDAEHEFRAEINSEDYKKHGIKMGFYRKLDRFSQLQLISGMDAMADGNLTIDETNEADIGILIGTADGPMTEIVNFQKKAITEGTSKGSAFAFPNTVYNAAGGYLSIFSGIKGYNVTVANGTQAGLQSICYAAEVLQNGEESIMLATGTDENTDVDAMLYNELGLCADSKPYDGTAKGFRLGEGSVSLMLETAESAEKRNAKPYAELVGFAAAHASVEYGVLQGSESAMEQAIAEACAMAGIEVEQLDAVCGFANGHADIDALELNVYRKLFRKAMPLFAVRETIGEARAAASTQQAALAAQILAGTAAAEQSAYVLTADQLEQTTVSTADYTYMLAIAAGTGGSYAAVVLKKIPGSGRVAE